jgi:hypothetical protein
MLWKIPNMGKTENFKEGNVKVTCCSSGSYYLGIRNPDSTYGINVLVEVVALVGSDAYAMEN